MEHLFTPKIMEILRDEFGELAQGVFDTSVLIQYLNIKTKSVSHGSKSRSAFANHYALYVLLEDYVNQGFVESGNYKDYGGARFSDLLASARKLPFGNKLQNHSFNNRLNDEFAKYFPTIDLKPIIRVLETKRYWINERLLLIKPVGRAPVNISRSMMKIIDAYVAAKRDAFDTFFEACQKMQTIQDDSPADVKDFIAGLIAPTSDARLFEVVSFAILKAYYGDLSIYWGWKRDDIHEEALILYKTGRTNANDGGIDFVMRPLGRFFQVTETVDVKKYFLDIDKVQKFPLTFVIKSTGDCEALRNRIRGQAQALYPVAAIVDQYMECIEEIIHIPILTARFEECVDRGMLSKIMDEIVAQSKVEYNYEDEEDDQDQDELIRETASASTTYVAQPKLPVLQESLNLASDGFAGDDNS